MLEVVGADQPSPVLQEACCCCASTALLQDEPSGWAEAGPSWVGRHPDGMGLHLLSAMILLHGGLLRCGDSLKFAAAAAAAAAAAVPQPGCAAEVGKHHRGLLQQGRVRLLSGELQGGGCLQQERRSGERS